MVNSYERLNLVVKLIGGLLRQSNPKLTARYTSKKRCDCAALNALYPRIYGVEVKVHQTMELQR